MQLSCSQEPSYAPLRIIPTNPTVEEVVEESKAARIRHFPSHSFGFTNDIQKRGRRKRNKTHPSATASVEPSGVMSSINPDILYEWEEDISHYYPKSPIVKPVELLEVTLFPVRLRAHLHLQRVRLMGSDNRSRMERLLHLKPSWIQHRLKSGLHRFVLGLSTLGYKMVIRQ